MAVPPPPPAGPHPGAAPTTGTHPGAAPAEGASASHTPPHATGATSPAPPPRHPGTPPAPLPLAHPAAPLALLPPGHRGAPPAAPLGQPDAPSPPETPPEGPAPPGRAEAPSPTVPTPPAERPPPPAAVPPPPAPAPPQAEAPTPPLPQPPSAPKQYTSQAADQMPGTCAATALPPVPAGPHPPGAHPEAVPAERTSASHTRHFAGAEPPAPPPGHPGAPPVSLPPAHPGAPRIADVRPELRKLLEMESQIEEIKVQIEQIMDFIMRPNSAGGGPVTGFGGPPPMMAGGGFDMQMPGGYDSHMPPSGAPMPGIASDYSAERFPGAHGPLDMDHWMSDSVGWPRDGPREHGRRTVSRENARLPRDDYTEDDQDNEERRSPRSRRRSSRHHQSSSPSHVASAYRAEPFRGAYRRPDMDVRMSGSAARPRDGPREHGRRTTSRKNGMPPRDDYTEGDQDNDEGWLPRSRRRISRHHQSSSSSHMASAYSAEPFPGAYQRPDMDVRMSGSAARPRDGPRERRRRTMSRHLRDDYTEDDQDNEERRSPRSRRTSRHHQSSSSSHKFKDSKGDSEAKTWWEYFQWD